ncbi:MAG: hypothetical protein D6799_07750, partial [Bacteroidetes bacterium]
ILLSFSSLLTKSQETTKLKNIREVFEKNKDDSAACLEYIKKLENDPAPEIQGYRAMFSFMMANHAIDPFSKWHYFSKGRKILEEQINQHPDNTELRFLRFVIQCNIPSILGYSDKISQDKELLLNALKSNQIKDEDLKQRIVLFLKSNHHLSEKEKKELL